MRKTLVLMVLALVMLTGIALADNDTKLEIVDIEARVDGDKDNGVDGDGGKVDDIPPGAELSFEIELENKWSSSDYEDLTIEDIEITAEIEDLDEGSDYEVEEDVDDIDAGKDEKVTVKFDVPLIVDEEEYDMTIKVEGEDENGTKHVDEVNITVKVEKENDELRITKKDLDTNTLSCGQSTKLYVTVVNTGSKDQDDVVLEVTNADLEIDPASYTIDEIEKGGFDDDDDVKVIKGFDINIPEDAEAQTYTLSIVVNYDDNKETESTTTDLVVDCAKPEPAEEPPEEEPAEEKEDTAEDTTPTASADEEITPPSVEPSTTSSQPPITIMERKSFGAKYGTALVVLLYIVVIGVGIAIFMKLKK